MKTSLIQITLFVIIICLFTMLVASCCYINQTMEQAEEATAKETAEENVKLTVEEKEEEIVEEETEIIENITEESQLEIEIEPTSDTIVEDKLPTEVELPTKDELFTEDEPVFNLSDYERWVVECMVMGESGAEPYDGQVLVAQCILNACLKDNLQPSQVRKAYGYYGWNSNPSENVKNAVSAVFDDGYKVTEKFILYFYAPKYSSGSWHETQCFVIEVGGHRFFSEWE